MSEPLTVKRTLWQRYWLAALYGLFALVVAAQRYSLNKHNVYIIFRSSFFNPGTP